MDIQAVNGFRGQVCFDLLILEQEAVILLSEYTVSNDVIGVLPFLNG